MIVVALLFVIVAVWGHAAVRLWSRAPSLSIMAWIDAIVAVVALVLALALAWRDRVVLWRAMALAIAGCVSLGVFVTLHSGCFLAAAQVDADILAAELEDVACDAKWVDAWNSRHSYYAAAIFDIGAPKSREKTLRLRWPNELASRANFILPLAEYRVATNIFPMIWHDALFAATTPKHLLELRRTFICTTPMDAPARAH